MQRKLHRELCASTVAGLSWRMPRPRGVPAPLHSHEKYADVVTYARTKLRRGVNNDSSFSGCSIDKVAPHCGQRMCNGNASVSIIILRAAASLCKHVRYLKNGTSRDLMRTRTYNASSGSASKLKHNSARCCGDST